MKKKKVLFCATVDYHFKAFHLPYFKWFQEQGWEVHVAAEGSMNLPYTDQKFTIPIRRAPLQISNIFAYKQLKAIIETEQYQLIHCHTPLGGVLSRLASKKQRKKGLKVIYTAHGFHFYKGAPLFNWMYYPIEKGLSFFTDCVITINDEDYQMAKQHFSSAAVKQVRGVGVSLEKYQPIGVQQKIMNRNDYHYTDKHFLMIYVAEFNKNKNHQLLIRAFAKIKDKLKGARLLFAGEGKLMDACQQLAKRLNVINDIDFLGFRHDLDQLLPICDLALSASLREGLPVNILEAMACGLPIIATNNRGHRELIQSGENGFLIDATQVEQISKKMVELYQSEQLRNQFARRSLEFVQPFSIERVRRSMDDIYLYYMMGDSHEAENQYYRAYL